MAVIWEPALSEEARGCRDLADRLTREHFAPLAAELDRDQRYPSENVHRLVEHELAGLFIPKRFGGAGASLRATAAVVETIARGCPSTAAILCTYRLGAFPVLLAGRDDQKQHYLGEMARGVATSFALSERYAGSDAAAAQSMGLALAAYREAAQRAVERHAFGGPIIENQGIGFRLADSAVEISAARLMLYEAASAYDQGRDIATLGAMAKLYASEVAHRAVDCAVQVWGGLGYCKPTVAERLYRDQRVLEIYEGTSEIQRLVLARAVRKEAEKANADTGANAP